MKKVMEERGYEREIYKFVGFFFLYFVAVFNSQKSPTPIAINGTNEIVTRKFRYLNLCSGKKVTNFNFLRTKKRIKNLHGWISNISIFIWMKNIF